MYLINKENEKDMREWFCRFSNDNILQHIAILERLLDSDDFGKSLLMDEGIALLEMLRDECVRRVWLVSERSVGLSDVV